MEEDEKKAYDLVGKLREALNTLNFDEAERKSIISFKKMLNELVELINKGVDIEEAYGVINGAKEKLANVKLAKKKLREVV